MTARWITGLVRARQFQEDNAKQKLATAERLASRAHARVRYNADRLDSLRNADAEQNAATFVAAAVALQAAAATCAAAAEAAAQADSATASRRDALTHAAVSRRSAEELADRARAAEKARQALVAQRAQDEIAASVFRRNHPARAPGDEPSAGPTGGRGPDHPAGRGGAADTADGGGSTRDEFTAGEDHP